MVLATTWFIAIVLSLGVLVAKLSSSSFRSMPRRSGIMIAALCFVGISTEVPVLAISAGVQWNVAELAVWEGVVALGFALAIGGAFTSAFAAKPRQLRSRRRPQTK